MVLTCLPAVPVGVQAATNAAGNTKITIVNTVDGVPVTQVQPGDVVRVTVSITGSDLYTAMGFNLDPSGTYFGVKSVSARKNILDAVYEPGDPAMLTIDAKGFVASSWLDEATYEGKAIALNGELFYYDITIKEDAPVGTFSIFNRITLKNSNDEVAYEVEGNELTIPGAPEETTAPVAPEEPTAPVAPEEPTAPVVIPTEPAAPANTKITIENAVNGVPVTVVKPGDVVTVTASISGTDGYTALGFNLTPDSAFFSVKTPSARKNILDAVYAPGDPAQLAIDTKGFVAASWPDFDQAPNALGDYPAKAVALNGELFYYEITIKADAPVGTFSIFNRFSLKNSNDAVAFEVEGNELTILGEVEETTAPTEAPTEAPIQPDMGFCEYCMTDVVWTEWAGGAIKTSGHYYLAEDVHCGNNAVSSGVQACLDLNGHTVKSTTRVFLINTDSRLVLMDHSPEQTGTVIGTTGTPSGSTTAGVLLVYKGGELIIYGGTYKTEKGTYETTSGGIITANGTEETRSRLIINGGTFHGQKVKGNGGTISVSGYTDVVINGGTFLEGSASYGDNLAMLSTTSTLTLNGGEFDGGVYLKNALAVNISGNVNIGKGANYGLEIDTNYVKLNVDHLSEDARIVLDADGIFTTAFASVAEAEAAKACFIVEDANKEITLEGTALKVADIIVEPEETTVSTEVPTEAPTEVPTEAPTEAPTEPVIHPTEPAPGASTKITIVSTVNGVPVTEVKPGDVVKVTASISGTDLYTALGFDLTPDSEFFAVKAPNARKNILDAPYVPGDPNLLTIDSKGFLAASWSDYDAAPDATGDYPELAVALNGELFYYEITIKADAPAGTFLVFGAIAIKRIDKDVAFEVEGNSLTVSGESHTHDFSTKKFDSTHHWYECECGEKDLVVTHTLVTKKNAQSHWNECSCGYASTKIPHTLGYEIAGDEHYQICGSCGYETEKADHAYNPFGWCDCGAQAPVVETTAPTEPSANTKITVVSTVNGVPVTEVKPGDVVKVTVSIAGTDTYTSLGLNLNSTGKFFSVKTPNARKNILDAVYGPGDPGQVFIDQRGFAAAGWSDYDAEPDADGGYPMMAVALNGDLFYYELTIKADAPVGTFSVFDEISIKRSTQSVAFDVEGNSLTVLSGPAPTEPAANTKVTIVSTVNGNVVTEVQPGDVVKVTASISGTDGYTALGFNLESSGEFFSVKTPSARKNILDAVYEPGDPAQLTIDQRGFAAASWPDYDQEPNANGDYPTKAVTLNGELFYIEITIKADAPVGTFSVFDAISIKNSAENVAIDVEGNNLTVVTAPHTHEFVIRDFDDTYHWNECACGAVDNKVTHTRVAKKNTEYHWNECSCGYVSEKIPHALIYVVVSSQHYQKCNTCGYETEKVNHAYDKSGLCDCGAKEFVPTANTQITIVSTVNGEVVTQVEPGDVVKVTVSITGTDKYTSLGFNLDAATKRYTVKNPSSRRNILDAAYEPGDPGQIAIDTKGFVAAGWIDYDQEPDAYGDYPQMAVALNGELFYYEITIKEDAPAGKFSIFDAISIKNDSEKVLFDVTGNTLTIPGEIEETVPVETVDPSEATVPAAPEAPEELFSYEVVNGEATITGCDTSVSGDITIPATLGGYPVTSLGNNAFYGCNNLTGVTIPQGVTSIGYRAFGACGNLLTVDIPDSVSYIGGSAFESCYNLISIVIPDGVTSIYSMTFYNCYSLTSMTIPTSVTSIGWCACNCCYNLTDIYYVGSQNQWNDIDIDDENYELTSANIHFNHVHDYSLIAPLMMRATCSADGYILYTCQHGETMQVRLPALGHDFDDIPLLYEPTCTEKGFTATTCTRCGKLNKTNFTDPLGHDFSVVVTVVAPTCTEQGYTVTMCTRCDTTENTNFVNATGHDMVDVPAEAATCTATGLTAGTKCTQCDYWGVRQTETPVLGHDYQASFAWSANHTACRANVTCSRNCGEAGAVNCVVTASEPHKAQTVHTATATYADEVFTDVLTCDNSLITFVNWDGTVLSSVYYHAGESVAVPENPVRAADNTYTYAFLGWDKTIVDCAGDATYKATYKATYIDYTVTFLDEDGTVLSSQIYHWGDKVIAPADPTKAADNVYTYDFGGWDKTVVNCAGNATYTATYEATFIEYTVEFRNWNGDVISSRTYHWDDEVVAPADPTKASDHIYHYTFAGWDEDVVNCAGDAIYTAVYTASYVDYTVVFRNWNGDVISSKTYHWGDKVTAPTAPTKAADNVYTYAFSGWDEEVVNCAGDATYTATYEATYIDYIVTFLDEDGKQLSKKTYHWGDKVTAPTAPTKAADNVYTYTFDGWDKDVVNCAGNATYTATYQQAYVEYTVTFRYKDGTIIAQLTLHYGDKVTAPDAPAAPNGYAFDGWDQPVTNCVGNATYIAVFRATVKPGDVNGDGVVSDLDALYLLRHTLFPARYPVACSGDVNGDGVVSDLDALYMLRHTLFPARYPLYPKK